MKLLILILIFLGELIGVYLEIALASKFKVNGSFSDILRFLFLLSPIFIICFSILLIGYIYGYRSFNKIWVVTIVSWSSILVVETLLNYFIFYELPRGKTLIGGILAIAAIVISII
jgi:hypothetical protein